jgi:Cytochrome c3
VRELATERRVLDSNKTVVMNHVTLSHRPLSITTLAVGLTLLAVSLLRHPPEVTAQSDNSCVTCHRQQTDSKVLTIFQTSTHGRSGIACDRCHGGDPSQAAKTKAHADHFIAKFDTPATLEMCGRCHRQPLEYFKASRHVAARPNAPRLDCVECHGVHAIGAYSESFRWTQFCAGCHGLEYLPALPRPFQEMLAMADDLNDGLQRLKQKGDVKPDLIQRRKEIRHMISELVHKTDSKGGAERIPLIMKLGAGLKRQIANAQNR